MGEGYYFNPNDLGGLLVNRRSGVVVVNVYGFYLSPPLPSPPLTYGYTSFLHGHFNSLFKRSPSNRVTQYTLFVVTRSF